jgi:uncharacterized repeat protein (TIGR01451 family)
MPTANASRLLRSGKFTFLANAALVVCLLGFWGVQSAYAGLSVSPTSWNVIGLDSNDQNSGPNTFQVGARVCNTGATPVTNVSANFVWDSFNSNINLSGAGTINLYSLASGACIDFHFPVVVTRTSAAFDTARRYHITVSGDSVASVSTPTPRELYVERIISQGRNSVNSITGPTTVYVGQTYNYTVNASTATQGYQQLEAFLELSNVIFQVQAISTTYSAPSGATNDKFYADACGWDNNPLSGSYRSCIGPENYSGGKAGGDIVTTYTVKVLSAGTTTAGTTILDFSGSSYHYNSDYGEQVISITALPPPLTLSKIANPTTATAGATVAYILRVANTGPNNYTLTDFIDTPPTSPAMPTYVSGSSYFNGASIPNPIASGSTRTWTGSYLIPAGQTRDLTYQMVMPDTPGTYVNTAIAHFNEFQVDTTPSTTDNAPATASVTVPPPDLTIAKTHTGNFTVGVNGTYTLTATNTGMASTSGTITVTDNLPTGLTVASIPTGTGWNCSTTVVGSSTATCTSSTVIAAGATSPNPITLTVVVSPAAFAASPVTNVANISGGGENNAGNNTASDPTTINGVPDLTITKTHSGNFTVGVNGTYTLTASNPGTLATSGTITVTDNLPTGLTVAALPTGTGWDCSTTVVGSSTATCTSSDVIAAGATSPNPITLTVVVSPAAFAASPVTNVANISGGSEPAYNNGNNTASDPTTINGVPDLTITKTHSGNFTQGQTGATYSITATNSGTATTSGMVTVTDALPAGLTATDISGAGWSCVLGTLTCTRNDALAAGASYPVITLTVNVSLTAPGSVTNSATISGGGENNASNNTANDLTTIDVAAPPSIGLLKSVSPGVEQIPGGDLLYTIVYTNTGGQPANNLIIVDPNMANVVPAERVFRNVDFKVGSLTSNPGSTGLVATFEYSNDGGTTWTYTPVSGGGGAPSGYDRVVTNVRWSFAGSLSQTGPNNTGGVGLTVRIR